MVLRKFSEDEIIRTTVRDKSSSISIDANKKRARRATERKKILENTSRRMKDKKDNANDTPIKMPKKRRNTGKIRRSSIDLSDSYSSKSLATTNNSSNNAIQSDGKKKAVLNDSEKKKKKTQVKMVDDDDNEQRQQLWTKLWAWKEQRDKQAQDEWHDNSEQVNKLLISQNIRSNNISDEID